MRWIAGLSAGLLFADALRGACKVSFIIPFHAVFTAPLKGYFEPTAEETMIWYERRSKNRPQNAAGAVFCGGVKVVHRGSWFRERCCVGNVVHGTPKGCSEWRFTGGYVEQFVLRVGVSVRWPGSLGCRERQFGRCSRTRCRQATSASS